MFTASQPGDTARRRLVVLAAMLCASASNAQTGVSDDRVSLPSGPGSLEGLGENVGLSLNMGAMTTSVPVEVPDGFDGLVPSLALTYSSGGGTSVVGMGWELDMPTVERMTYRGLPRYDLDDDFAGLAGQQLVRVPGSNPPVYRHRYEGSFIRYTWKSAGSGAEGYWVAEYPNGHVATFGAKADGTLVPSARVSGPAGTYKYHLVEQTDPFGHALRYEYTKSGVVSLMQRIGWVHGQDGEPRYSVTCAYEDAADAGGTAHLSDAKPGFEVRLMKRLKTLSVFSGTDRIRRYELTYQPYDESGGFTRLTRVRSLGHQGGVYPVVFDFSYSQALGGVCAGAGCQSPFLVDLGDTNVNVSTGRATLVDLDGNALPDLVSTPVDGNHQIHLGVPSETGTTAFAPPTTSQHGTSSFRLGTGWVQTLDVNGDGLSDLLDGKNASYLPNTGSGDWGPAVPIAEGTGPDFAADFDPSAEEQLKTLRFVDYDNDKRIDVIKSTLDSTQIYRNLGAQGFELDQETEAIGEGFAASNLDLIDMNGDGLLDPVVMSPGIVRYRLNLGWGKWGAWILVENVPTTAATLPVAELEDLNGDALADLVIVSGTTVQVALSRNGERFMPLKTITSADLGGAQIPERKVDTTVLFADMNGSGSTDIVWLDGDGRVRYLELYPVRPNLLNRIENGLGAVTEVKYGTSVAHLARDLAAGKSWSYPLPHPMIVVDELVRYEALAPDVREVTRQAYHDGFYSGAEKQFRGYEHAEEVLVGDEHQEGGETRATFDVGAADDYRKGLLVESTVSSGGRTLSRTENTYSDCPVGGVTGDPELPIRHICPTKSRVEVQEGLEASRWIATESETTWDGYGNATKVVNRGVVSIGGGACPPCSAGLGTTEFGAPCGPSCLGDETTTETTYVPPAGSTQSRWIVHAPVRVRSYGVAGGATTESNTYYDGADFVGLPAGQLSQGLVTRVTVKRSADSADVIAASRLRYNTDGMVAESLDPLGAPSSTGHRRVYVYDDTGLRVRQVDVYTGATQLRQELQYEPLFDKPVEATAWMRVKDGVAVTPRRSTYYTYDEFGRLAEVVQPGDSLESPSQVHSYELASPVSRVVTKARSAVGGALDLESVTCLDGKGRTVQSRTRLAAGKYQVTGLSIFNVRNAPVRVYQPFTASTGACEATVPAGTLAADTTYDAANRPIETREPDEALYGSRSVSRMSYEPLAQLAFDEEDSDPSSPHHDTPQTIRSNGLGKVVAIERELSPGQASSVHLRYDPLGRLVRVLDPAGNARVQTFDLLGRVLTAEGPNSSGTSSTVYDDAGNVVRETDDRGVVTLTTYDGLNRPVARWAESDKPGTLITWTYDQAPAGCDTALCTHLPGALSAVTYPLPGLSGAGREWHGYDVRGRSAWRMRSLGDFDYEQTFTYDNADRIVETVQPDGTVLASSYDNASRLTAIDGYVASFTYDGRGLLAGMNLANGVKEELSYDARMRLSEARTARAGVVLQGTQYTRSRVGNLLGVQDLSASGGASSQLEYDAWYRLTEVTQAGESLSFDFDALDNLLKKTSSVAGSPADVGSYTYGSPNAVKTAGSLSFEYDEAGHVVKRGPHTYAWDAFGRMDRAALAQGGEELLRSVHGAGAQRVAKVEHGDETTLYIAPDFEVRDGVSVTYVRSGGARLARTETTALQALVYSDVAPALSPDGEIHAADAWMSWAAAEGIVTTSVEPSAPRALLSAAARRLLLEEDGETTTWLHRDHLGSVALATDAVGDVTGSRAFHATGTLQTDTGWVDRYGFTGQEHDQSTGLVSFAARCLDPVTGRWMSIDPLFERPTETLVSRLGESTTDYAYVAGNFANAVDPLGLAGKLVNAMKSLGRRLGGRGGGAGAAAGNARYGDASATYAAAAAGSADYAASPAYAAAGGNYASAQATGQSRVADGNIYGRAVLSPSRGGHIYGSPIMPMYARTGGAVGGNYARTPNAYGRTPNLYARTPSLYAKTPSLYAKTPSLYSRTPATGPSSNYANAPEGHTATYANVPQWHPATYANAPSGLGQVATYVSVPSGLNTPANYANTPVGLSTPANYANAPAPTGPYGSWTPVSLH